MKDSKVNKKYNPCIVPTSLIKSCARGLQAGLDKGYEPKSYLNGDIEVYKNALFRHLIAYLEGHTVDSESGLNVLDHISANVAILIELEGQRPKDTSQYVSRPCSIEEKPKTFSVILTGKLEGFFTGMVFLCIKKNGRYYIKHDNGKWASVDISKIDFMESD